MPRVKCKICDTFLVEFPEKAPKFMFDYYAYCPECKVVYYVGEDL